MKKIFLIILVLSFTLKPQCVFAENIEEPKLEDLVDVSDREDLIASGKIKPAPEFVEIDGKKVRTSPEKYESEDECDKAEELLWYRKDIELYKTQKQESFDKYYEYIVPGLFYFNILMRDNNKIRVIGCFSSGNCSHSDPKKEFKYVLLKQKSGYDGYLGILEFADKYSNLKGFDEKKYIFMKKINCKVIFYKGKNFKE